MAKVIPLSGHRTGPNADGAWGAMSDELWPAWNGMLGAEAQVLEAFGEMLGEKLLVLWALSRFGDEGTGAGTLAELVDEDGRPRFGDWLAEDMLTAAFALGAAWASGRQAPGQGRTAPTRPIPREHTRRHAI